MRRKFRAVTIALAFVCGDAYAVNADTYGDVPYIAGSWLREAPDTTRNSDTGSGTQINFGLPLRYPGWAVEGSFYEVGRKGRTDSYHEDFQRSFFANAVRDLGTQDWSVFYLPKFKPYLIAGLGGVDDNVLGVSHLNFGIDLGGGILFPLGYRGAALRIEAMVIGENNGTEGPGDDHQQYADYHLNLGIEMPLSFLRHGPPPREAVFVSCPLVVNPYTGRKSCAADSSTVAVADADHDGVPDPYDFCANTAPGFRVDSSGCALPQITVMPQLGFAAATAAVLTSPAKQTLDQIAAMLLGQPNMHLEIDAYTDNSGSPASAMELTVQRAGVIADYLVSKGVDRSRLNPLGNSPAKSIASNETADGRSQNRRVEFKVSVE